MDQFNRAREEIGAATYTDNWRQVTNMEAPKYATALVRNEGHHQVRLGKITVSR